MTTAMTFSQKKDQQRNDSSSILAKVLELSAVSEKLSEMLASVQEMKNLPTVRNAPELKNFLEEVFVQLSGSIDEANAQEFKQRQARKDVWSKNLTENK